MSSQRFQQIESLYTAALERPLSEREAFLAAACAGDADLRREVESLLAYHSKADFLEVPAIDVAARAAASDSHPSPIPATIGKFQVLALIGKGGMGEVWRARDTRLQRDVAIKVLPEDFAADPERLSRFKREAQTLASLNHPNIATIYDFVQEGCARFIVLELVEGQTLAERIQRGPVPLKDALAIARQIADALEAAHEKGIVHRDLKPANVKITPEGKVKVLDFGLVKISVPLPGMASPSDVMTAAEATYSGMILGTPGYLSPEQARGMPVDKRTDIWAFGVVLYEMLTGEPPFKGETISDILAATLKEDPDCDIVPAQVRPLLRRCLEKNPSRRLRDAGDFESLLETIPNSISPRRTWIAWIAAAAGLLGFSLVSFVHFRETQSTAPADSLRFQIQLPEKLTLPRHSSASSISPNGRQVAFFAQGPDGIARLWIRDLDSLEVRQLPGTEARLAQTLFWSPDSHFIAFDAGEKLKKVAVAGGPPQTICDLPGLESLPFGGAWNRDDVIILGASTGGLRRVSAQGGVAEPFTTPDTSHRETAHAYPSFLPDGRHFIYHRTFDAPGKTGAYVGSLDVKPDEQSSQQLVATMFSPVYVSSTDHRSGHLLFMRGATLFAQPFDAQSRVLSGEPVIIAEQVAARFGDYGRFSASENGRLVYLGTNEDLRLTWYDRAGKVVGVAGETNRYKDVILLPDGKRAIVSLPDPRTGTEDLWLLDLSNGEPRRLTFDPANDFGPVSSADGTRIAFVSDRGHAYGLYQIALNGPGKEEPVFSLGQFLWQIDWSRDGNFLLYSSGQTAASANDDLWVLPLRGERKPVLFSGEPSHERMGRFSPDSRWIAYMDALSGDAAIYVRPFDLANAQLPDHEQDVGSSNQRPSMIAKGLVDMLRWRNDGKELFYRVDGNVMAVEITTNGPAFQHGSPVHLFTVPANSLPSGGRPSLADVTADGQRFLFAIRANTREELTVVLNWTAGLKK